MNISRYPAGSLMPDILRAVAGIAVCMLVLSQLDGPGVAFWILTALTVVFVAFGGLTALRARLKIEFDEQRLVVNPGAREIQWRALSALRLDYFATRRDREHGWMQLRLYDVNGQRVKLDSRLDTFEALVATAADAARRNGLELEMSTLENLKALGHQTGTDMTREEGRGRAQERVAPEPDGTKQGLRR